MIPHLRSPIGSSFSKLPLLLTGMAKEYSDINKGNAATNLASTLENVYSIFSHHKVLYTYEKGEVIV